MRDKNAKENAPKIRNAEGRKYENFQKETDNISVSTTIRLLVKCLFLFILVHFILYDNVGLIHLCS